MAKRLKKTANKSTATPSGDVLSKQVMDSAQKIWLAGLGAFSKAQEEGGIVFEMLVKQGQALEKKTRAVAGQAVESAKAQANETVGKAAGTIDRLDQVFQDRVHRSLNKLGVLTAKDIDDLTKQVTELSESVRGLIATEKTATRRKAANTAATKVKKAAQSRVKRTVAKVTKATNVARKTAKTAAKQGMKQATKVARKVKAKLS